MWGYCYMRADRRVVTVICEDEYAAERSMLNESFDNDDDAVAFAQTLSWISPSRG